MFEKNLRIRGERKLWPKGQQATTSKSKSSLCGVVSEVWNNSQEKEMEKAKGRFSADSQKQNLVGGL
jgi:hypothetical protein